jgi:cell division protein FtsN
MKTQMAQGAGASSRPTGFPTALLTFSVMLLVLAIGFVLGRVVVARAYLGSAPKIDLRGSGGSELDGRAAPGHVYVPSPSASRPPEEASSEERSPKPPTAEHGQSPDETTSGAPEGPQAAGSTVPPAEQPSQAEAPPAQETKPAEESSNKTYSIQVGVFTSTQGARQVMDELTRAGYPSRVARDKRGSQDLYRVVTGRYRSEYAARKAMEQLRTEGFEAFLVAQ